MRIIVMGTGPFAVPTLEALYASRHEVAAVVTQPPRDVRGKTHASPMREAATARGALLLDPAKVNDPDSVASLSTLQPDLLVVADYGQILAPDTLAVARYGGVNLHGSILPRYRGAAPINWAIYNGDAETGVTVIGMTPRVDAGPCLAIAKTAIDPDEDAVALEARLASLGAPIVASVIDDIEAGRASPMPQDATFATPARRLRKTDARLDWTRTALELKNQIRAFEPWPRNYTFWLRGAEPLRISIGKASLANSKTAAAEAGTVLAAACDDLIVVTGSGALALHGVQPASKRMLTTAEFLRGYPIKPGDRLAMIAE